MLTVALLSITPVKGLGLHHPDEVDFGPDGVVGDRRFYLIDERGRRFNGIHCGELVQIRPRYDRVAETLTLSFPDGEEVEADVVPGDRVRTAFFGRRMVDGEVVEGPFAGALSRFAGRPLRLARTVKDADGADVHPISLMGDGSLHELGRQAGLDGPVDGRRFRMLVTIAGTTPHQEDGWVGGTVRVGDAVVSVPGPIPRCVVTTQDPATGRKDLNTLARIKGYRGLGAQGTIDFGVYGVVERPGRVRVGDEVDPEPARAPEAEAAE